MFKKQLKCLVFLSLIFLNLVTPFITAAESYQVDTTKGTDFYEVIQYDEDSYKDIVNKSHKPDDIFGKDADKVGAQSKITKKAFYNPEWNMYDVMVNLLVTGFIPLLITYQDELNFTEKEINKKYSDKFDVWYTLSNIWEFTTNEFEEDADLKNIKLPVFFNPDDLKTILDNYNDWTRDINPNLILLSLPPLQNYTGDDLLWLLVINHIQLALPTETYLATLLKELKCKNVDAEDNMLIFEKNGKDDYTVEVTYRTDGTQSNIIFKDEDGNIIYELRLNTAHEFFFYMIILVMIIGIVLIVIVAKVNKRKRK